MNRRLQYGHTGQQGFTLIELLVTVVIIAMLASVAVPSYLKSVKRSARNEVRAVLTETQLWMEQRYSVNNTYLASDGTIPTLPFPQSPKTGVAKYKITLDKTSNASMYILKATPEKDVDDLCATFVVDNTGKRTVEGTAVMSAQDCWAGK